MIIEHTRTTTHHADLIGSEPSTTERDAYAEGYRRGWDVATERARSRLREGLEIAEPKRDE